MLILGHSKQLGADCKRMVTESGAENRLFEFQSTLPCCFYDSTPYRSLSSNDLLYILFFRYRLISLFTSCRKSIPVDSPMHIFDSDLFVCVS